MNLKKKKIIELLLKYELKLPIVYKKKIKKHGKSFFVRENVPFLLRFLRKIREYETKSFWDTVNDNTWEKETFIIFDKFLSKESSYIDIGAWIGPTVLYGCQKARHCYAIEPDPIALKELQDNITLNKKLKRKITLYNGCIGDKCGNIQLGNKSDFGNSGSSILFNNAEDRIMVPCLTLEEFIKKNAIHDCNFIKMDIEGGESVVMPNIKNYLKKNKPTLHLSLHSCFFNDLEDDSNNIIDVLKVYDNVFDSIGESLELNVLYSDILIKGKPYDIVATDRQWI